jgi:hypothetical protein
MPPMSRGPIRKVRGSCAKSRPEPAQLPRACPDGELAWAGRGLRHAGHWGGRARCSGTLARRLRPGATLGARQGLAADPGVARGDARPNPACRLFTAALLGCHIGRGRVFTMDLVELRLLAVGGILAVGVVMSVLGVLAATILEWAGQASHTRTRRVAGQRAVGRMQDLGAGRERC